MRLYSDFRKSGPVKTLVPSSPDALFWYSAPQLGCARPPAYSFLLYRFHLYMKTLLTLCPF
jgi:hypothetical protein